MELTVGSSSKIKPTRAVTVACIYPLGTGAEIIGNVAPANSISVVATDPVTV